MFHKSIISVTFYFMEHLFKSLSSEVDAVNFVWFIPFDCTFYVIYQYPAG